MAEGHTYIPSDAFSPAQLGQYHVVGDIAEGTFGKVKMARHVVTGHTVAMKYISKRLINLQQIKTRVYREVDYMRTLRHPHIIKLYEVINTASDIILVLEFVSGELFQLISGGGRLEEKRARRFFQQLISGLDYSHRLKIVHRDLKPENLLLDDQENLKIADFGLSNRMTDGEFLKTSCGSPNYAAPEVITGSLYVGPEVDVWSAGVVLYVMIVGSLPFEDTEIPALFAKVRNGQFHIPSWVPRDIQDLLRGMINVDPQRRLTIPEILQSPWVYYKLPLYLQPLPPPPGPMLGMLSSLVESKPPTFEVIPGLGRVDEEAIIELSRRLKGVTREDILDALRRPEGSNSVKIAYSLVRDEKRKKCDIAEWEKEEREAYLMSIDPKHNLSPVLSPGGDPSENPFDTEFGAEDEETGEEYAAMRPLAHEQEEHHMTVLHSSLMQHSELATSQPTTPRTPRRRPHRMRWHFGIRSRSPPMEVMLEIYKVLKTHGAEWRTKRVLGGLGGVPDPAWVAQARGGESDEFDGIDLKAASSIFLIETRTRIDDVVVLMNIQLYQLDNDSNYLVDFHHKGYYQATKKKGAPAFDMKQPGAIEYLERTLEPQNDQSITSPYLFMKIACALITELAGGPPPE
ncbi:Pkinase-domain-containing protein [Auriculariales sp. MPI-PUGE-AT-0066]|nr:Pkinase-domain-containing protein [Auriculariales sp. MPI-PUGE-AT-0066]